MPTSKYYDNNVNDKSCLSRQLHTDAVVMSLGERIHVACVAAGISQAELARRVPCKPQQITDLAKNKRGFSKHFPRMAEVLGVHVSWLTTGEGPWKPGADSSPTPIPADTAEAILKELKELRDEVAALRKIAKNTAGQSGPTDIKAKSDREVIDAFEREP